MPTPHHRIVLVQWKARPRGCKWDTIAELFPESTDLCSLVMPDYIQKIAIAFGGLPTPPTTFNG